MRKSLKINRWLLGIIAIAALFAVPASPVGQVAQAHGKELSLEVSSFTPDPQEPLVRLYRAFVMYASDRDPVLGAKVQFSAERQGGGPPLEPVLLEPLNEPGLYAAQVSYPLYGTWNVTLGVSEQGEGKVSFVEEVVPAGPTRTSDDVRQQVLQLFFRFDWKDVAAIVVRISHSLAGTVWFGMTAVILGAYWFLHPTSRRPLFQRLSRVFMPASMLSLTVLAASGVYSAIFSAPIKAPGVFDFDTMWEIPFGPAYLATMAFKVFAGAVCVILAVRMGKALRLASFPVPAGGSVQAVERWSEAVNGAVMVTRREPLLRLAVVNAVVGVLLAISIALSVYLHYISHLAVFLPD